MSPPIAPMVAQVTQRGQASRKPPVAREAARARVEATSLVARPTYANFCEMTDDELAEEVRKSNTAFYATLSDEEFEALEESRKVFVTAADIERDEFMAKDGHG